MLFNCNKSLACCFYLSSSKLLIYNSEISFVQSVKYLGLHISSDLTDDIDIQRQVKSLYCSANKLKQQFSKCSLEVKNYIFKHFCMPFLEATCGVITVNLTSVNYVFLTMILIEFCNTYPNG